MTPEQLLQPRYLCESPTDSHYPYSPFKVGDIISLNQISGSGSNCCTINGVVYSDVALDKYPHLFRRLKWWEFRDEKDMPEYVKCNMSPDNFHFPGYVYKIQSLNGIWYSNIQMAIIFETNCYTPATKEEYDNQKTITMTAHQIIKDEVELLQSWIDQSKTGGWSTHLVKPMEDRILYLQKIHFELSSPSSSAGVWVRASERLPDVETSYHVKIYGRPGFAKWYSEKMEFGFEATNGFGTLRQDHFEQIEWLDESPVSTPSGVGSKW